MLVSTWSEIKGIQSAVFEAMDREDKAEQLEKEAFEAWKKSGEEN
jgi:IMP cyclohydrolase